MNRENDRSAISGDAGAAPPASSTSPHDSAEDWLEELDHTGDVGFLIRSGTLEGLFERAAQAMFRVLLDGDASGAPHELELEVEAPDLEALLVRWLSELNYLHQVDGWTFADFGVRLTGASSLRGVLRGDREGAAHHIVQTEIKAVTYHGLYIRRDGEQWAAQIIFDL